MPVHHICTNKCTTGIGDTPAWTPRFQAFFDHAGLDIDSEINKIAVPGHRGPHPQEYHQYVYRRLESSTSGIPPGTSEYTSAMERALERLKQEAITPGSAVNGWLTGN